MQFQVLGHRSSTPEHHYLDSCLQSHQSRISALVGKSPSAFMKMQGFRSLLIAYRAVHSYDVLYFCDFHLIPWDLHFYWDLQLRWNLLC